MMGINDDIKVTRNELIHTFSDIDVKISNLYQRSSVDFMQLNSYLKDYHKKAQIISENAFKIFETLGGNKDINLIEELYKIHQQLEDSKEKIKNNDSRKIQILKEIMQKTNQLSIALRNIKQDFTSFKFLSTNYSLISNYKEFDLEWENGLETWNAEIQTLQGSITSATDQIENFKELIASNIGYLESKVERSLLVFQNLSKEIKTNIGSVALKSHESKLHFPVLKKKISDSSKSISDIIKYLQYQDIIRQKIEHIQKSHSKIIEDLNQSILQNNEEEGGLLDDFLKIGDIADLQAAQLLLVSKEYQNALSIITKNFQGAADDITTISGISDEFSHKDSNSEITLLKQIKDQLDEGIILLDFDNFREINTRYKNASCKFNEITGQIKKEIQDPLCKLILFDRIKNIKQENADSVPGILLQITSLINDIEIKNRDIFKKINEIKNLSASIFTSDDLETRGSQLEQDRIKLMVDISRVLDALDKDNEDLDNVLSQNKELNINIVEKIENVINKIDYYIYFETIVEQVISQLNNINCKLKSAFPTKMKKSVDKAANLNDIKTSYTMNSERVIHENVVFGINEPDIISSESVEDEIEFF